MAALDAAMEIAGEDLDDVEFVASGGAGTVYRAVQLSLGRVVAVKVLHGLDLRDDRTAHEARVQARMSWHSNVITLFGTTQVNGASTALVMEFASGGSLSQRIARTGALGLDDWLQLARELSSALAAAHASGIVHRDVKPSNVLFAVDGSSRLADFGIAGTSTITIDELEASVAYAAPELLEGDRPSAPNDVFSMALTLLVAASGRHPFGEDLPVAPLAARLQSERIRFADHVVDWPGGLVELMDRCLDLDPDERPTSAEFRDALVSEPATDVVAATGSPMRAGIQKWVGVGLVACLAGTVVVASRWSPDDRISAVDACEVFDKFERDRIEIFSEVSRDVEGASSPVEVVDRLLVRYPLEWSAAVQPLVAAGPGSDWGAGNVTGHQLSEIAVVEALQVLNGGRAYLSGDTSTRDLAWFPGELRAPASSTRNAIRIAGERCGSSSSELLEARARMYSAVFASLADDRFMDAFFADPRSFTLISGRLVELMAASARPFVENLIADHRGWLLELLLRSADVRQALSTAHPDLVFAAAETNVEAFTNALDEDWLEELSVGLERSGPTAHASIEQTFPGAFAAFSNLLPGKDTNQ